MERTGGSRLLQMQARFQQKQMQEREMKIASLYEAQQARALDRVRHSPSNPTNGVHSVSSVCSVSSTSPTSPPPAPVTHQPGKVRQMFEERRTKGIDKSYPLQPIHNTQRTPPRKPLPNGYSRVANNTSKSTAVTADKKKTHISNSTHTVRSQQKISTKIHKTENLVNGSGDVNHNHEPADHNGNTKHATPHSNGEVINYDEVDKAGSDYLLENETFPESMEPLSTPRSPQHREEPKKTVRKSPAVKSSPARTKPQTTPAPSTRKPASDTMVSESSRARGAMQRIAQPTATRKSPVASTGVSKARLGSGASSARAGSGGGAGSPGGVGSGAGEPCAVCGRRFAADRVEKHQEICARAHAKKRKPFDALKHRLAGTEAEPFIGKLRKGTTTAVSSTKVNKSQNNNWRQKHEEFIQAIRAAKQVKAHLAAGGKLSDLPPPPPSENPDYVQCPHCGRRFNQGAAERHIPKCASYQFNKPKPAAAKRR